MLQLQTRAVIAAAELRDRIADIVRRGREGGATSVEYAVIVAVLFVAAGTLAAVIVSRIETESNKIAP